MNIRKLYLSTIDDHAQDLARENGLGLEIAEYCTAWNMDREFEQTDRKVRPKLDCSDRFVLHGPYNELFPCAIDPKARLLAADRFRQAIDLALSYDIHKMVLHGGYNPWLYFACWYTEQSVIFWKDFVRTMPDDMEICLENVMEEEPSMIADIVRQTGSPRLRMCLDVGHVNAYSKVPAADWIASCADVLDHFHVHNNDTTWDTHSPLDQGSLDMRQLLPLIDSTCPAATVTLELMDGASSVQWLKNNNLLEE